MILLRLKILDRTNAKGLLFDIHVSEGTLENLPYLRSNPESTPAIDHTFASLCRGWRANSR